MLTVAYRAAYHTTTAANQHVAPRAKYAARHLK